MMNDKSKFSKSELESYLFSTSRQLYNDEIDNFCKRSDYVEWLYKRSDHRHKQVNQPSLRYDEKNPVTVWKFQNDIGKAWEKYGVDSTVWEVRKNINVSLVPTRKLNLAVEQCS